MRIVSTANKQMLLTAIVESKALAFRQYTVERFDSYDALIEAINESMS